MAMAATHIRDFGARAQFFLDAAERRQPLANQTIAITISVEGRDAAKKTFIVLVPGNAFAGAKGRDGFLFVEKHRNRHFPRRRHEYRAVILRQHQRLLRGELVGGARGMINNITGRRLAIEPLAHVALRAARAFGDFR